MIQLYYTAVMDLLLTYQNTPTMNFDEVKIQLIALDKLVDAKYDTLEKRLKISCNRYRPVKILTNYKRNYYLF